MNYFSAVLLAVFLTVPATFAEERLADSISTPGRATAEVSADEVVVNFELEAESDSFSDAVAAAEETAARLETVSLPADGVSVKVDYDVTFMRQKKWGRGSKLSHRFEMVVRGVPDGSTQETLVQIVDSVVKLEPRVTVESYEARLSDARSRQARDRLLREAVANARHNAEVIASAGGMILGSPQSIVVGSRPRQWIPADGDGVLYEAMTVRSRAFSVGGDLGSNVPVTVNVWVVFHTTPM